MHDIIIKTYPFTLNDSYIWPTPQLNVFNWFPIIGLKNVIKWPLIHTNKWLSFRCLKDRQGVWARG